MNLAHLLKAGRKLINRRDRTRQRVPNQRGRTLLIECLEDRTAPVVFLVNSLLDTSDNNPGDGIADDGAGNATLRAAMEEANALAGVDTIQFGVSGTIAPGFQLPTIEETLTIDGYTAPGASVNTNGAGQGFNTVLTVTLDGVSAGAFSAGLQIGASGSVIRGLGIQRFDGPGIAVMTSGATIEGNFIGTNAAGTMAAGNNGPGIVIDGDNNVIGSTSGLGNLISGGNGMGIFVGSGADNNQIVGNLIGTTVGGTSAMANALSGIVVVGASSNTIGGPTAGARNVISGNGQKGIELSDALSSGNIIQGNYIGTDVTGAIDLGNTEHGIQVVEASGTRIGGTNTGEGNVISGNNQFGVTLNQAPSATIQGNLIGTDKNGTGNVGNFDSGIFLDVGVSNTTIGGTSAGAGNVIAFNGAGVGSGPGLVLSFLAGAGNRAMSNSFFSNAGIGIDLNQDSVQTPNDVDDTDSGPNSLQNFPVISRAEIDGSGNLIVDYVVDSTIGNADYPLTVEFFKADSAASGEGMVLLDSDTYAFGNAQSAKANVDLGSAATLGVTGGNLVVATATDADGNTSEFSAVLAISAVAVAVPLTHTGTSGGDNLILRLNQSADTIQIVDANTGNVLSSALKAATSNAVINTLDGNDSLTIEETNGLIDVPGGVQFDGGPGIDSLRLTGSAPTETTYRVGPGVGAGLITRRTANGTSQVSFTGLEPVFDDAPGTLAVIATNADNAINIAVGSNSELTNASNPTGADTAVVSVDNFEIYEFANKTTVTIDGLAGQDVFGVSNLSIGFSGPLVLQGGDPADGDELILGGSGGDDTFSYLPHPELPNAGVFTGLGGGLLFFGIENVTVTGGLGDDALNALGNVGTATRSFRMTVPNESGSKIFAGAFTTNSTSGTDTTLTARGSDGLTPVAGPGNDNSGPLNAALIAGAAVPAGEFNVNSTVGSGDGQPISQFELVGGLIAPSEFMSEAEPNNTTGEVDPIAVNIDQSDRIAQLGQLIPGMGDIDVIAVNINQSDRIAAIVNNDPNGNNQFTRTNLRFLDTNGEVIATGSNPTAAANAMITTPLAAGTYFIEVTNSAPDGESDYEIVIFGVFNSQAQDSGPENNSPQTGAPVRPKQYGTGYVDENVRDDLVQVRSESVPSPVGRTGSIAEQTWLRYNESTPLTIVDIESITIDPDEGSDTVRFLDTPANDIFTFQANVPVTMPWEILANHQVFQIPVRPLDIEFLMGAGADATRIAIDGAVIEPVPEFFVSGDGIEDRLIAETAGCIIVTPTHYNCNQIYVIPAQRRIARAFDEPYRFEKNLMGSYDFINSTLVMHDLISYSNLAEVTFPEFAIGSRKINFIGQPDVNDRFTFSVAQNSTEIVHNNDSPVFRVIGNDRVYVDPAFDYIGLGERGLDEIVVNGTAGSETITWTRETDRTFLAFVTSTATEIVVTTNTLQVTVRPPDLSQALIPIATLDSIAFNGFAGDDKFVIEPGPAHVKVDGGDPIGSLLPDSLTVVPRPDEFLGLPVRPIVRVNWPLAGPENDAGSVQVVSAIDGPLPPVSFDQIEQVKIVGASSSNPQQVSKIELGSTLQNITVTPSDDGFSFTGPNGSLGFDDFTGTLEVQAQNSNSSLRFDLGGVAGNLRLAYPEPDGDTPPDPAAQRIEGLGGGSLISKGIGNLVFDGNGDDNLTIASPKTPSSVNTAGILIGLRVAGIGNGTDAILIGLRTVGDALGDSSVITSGLDNLTIESTNGHGNVAFALNTLTGANSYTANLRDTDVATIEGGDAAGDMLTLRRFGNVWNPTGARVASGSKEVQIAGAGRVEVQGAGGDDTLIVDVDQGRGSDVIGLPIFFDGGAGFDTLDFIGQPVTQVETTTYRPGPQVDAGRVEFDDQGGGRLMTVDFTGLEPVQSQIGQTVRVSGTPNDDHIRVGSRRQNLSGNHDRDHITVNVGNYESFTFTVDLFPNDVRQGPAMLILEGLGGNDDIEVDMAARSFLNPNVAYGSIAIELDRIQVFGESASRPGAPGDSLVVRGALGDESFRVRANVSDPSEVELTITDVFYNTSVQVVYAGVNAVELDGRAGANTLSFEGRDRDEQMVISLEAGSNAISTEYATGPSDASLWPRLSRFRQFSQVNLDMNGGSDEIVVRGTELGDAIEVSDAAIRWNNAPLIAAVDHEIVTVDAAGGEDSITVRSSDALEINVDGGVASDTLTVLPRAGLSFYQQIVVSPGADNRSGEVQNGKDVRFANLDRVVIDLENNPANVVIEGTDGDNAIALAGLRTTIDDRAPVDIRNAPVVSEWNVSAREGNDTIRVWDTLNGLIVGISGGGPSASDTLVIEGSDENDTIAYFPDPAFADRARLLVNSRDINFFTIEHVIIDGREGDDSLGASGSVAPNELNDVVELTPTGHDESRLRFNDSSPVQLFDLESVAIDPQDGLDQLRVFGTSHFDLIALDAMTVEVNDQSFAHTRTEIFAVFANAGDDMTDITGGLTGVVTVDGGDGADHLSLASPNTNAVGIALPNVVSDGSTFTLTTAAVESFRLAGSESLLVSGAPDAGSGVTITPTSPDSVRLKGGQYVYDLVTAGTLTLSGAAPAFGSQLPLRRIDVHASLFDDAIEVSGSLIDVGSGLKTIALAGIASVRVFGEEGSDTFDVTPATTTSFFVDGGDPIGFGDSLNVRAAQAVLHPGPEYDEGSYEVPGARPISFDRIETVQVLAPLIAAQVTNVGVSGTQWAANLGWQPIPCGSQQTAPLAWSNVNQIAIEFTQDVDVEMTDLTLTNGQSPLAIDSFAYTADAQNSRYIATWTQTEVLRNGLYQITLNADSVVGGANLRLDGEWSDNVSMYPSGNDVAGGDFVFGFTVVAGDSNQSDSVDVFDLLLTRLRIGAGFGQPAYDPRFDINGDSVVNVIDVLLSRLRIGTQLLPATRSAGTRLGASETVEPIPAGAPMPFVTDGPKLTAKLAHQPRPARGAEGSVSNRSTSTVHLDSHVAGRETALRRRLPKHHRFTSLGAESVDAFFASYRERMLREPRAGTDSIVSGCSGCSDR